MNADKMSYCQKIKEYLSSDLAQKFGFNKIDNEKVSQEQLCCARSFIYGVILFCEGFGVNEVTIRRENDFLLELCAYILINYFDIHIETAERKSKKNEKKYAISIPYSYNILELFNYSKNELSYYKINKELFECNNCKINFIKGAFLSCALISDPDKEYHLEFVCARRHLCEDFNAFMFDIGFLPKTIVRHGQYSIYFKDSSQIEDILTYIGAHTFSMDIMNKKVYKSFVNNANRAKNFDNANIMKTVDAFLEVQKAISILKENNQFYSLPPKLRQTAEMRIKYSEATLLELCEYFDPPISKSGIYHRLKKIVKIAESIEKKKG